MTPFQFTFSIDSFKNSANGGLLEKVAMVSLEFFFGMFAFACYHIPFLLLF